MCRRAFRPDTSPTRPTRQWRSSSAATSARSSTVQRPASRSSAMGELLLDAVLFLSRIAAGAELDKNLLNKRESIANDFGQLDELTLEEYFRDDPVQGNTSQNRSSYVYLPMVSDPPLVPILS